MSVNSKENGLLKNVEKKFRPKTFATFAAEHFKLGPSDKKLYLSDAVSAKISHIDDIESYTYSGQLVNDFPKWVGVEPYHDIPFEYNGRFKIKITNSVGHFRFPTVRQNGIEIFNGGIRVDDYEVVTDFFDFNKGDVITIGYQLDEDKSNVITTITFIGENNTGITESVNNLVNEVNTVSKEISTIENAQANGIPFAPINTITVNSGTGVIDFGSIAYGGKYYLVIGQQPYQSTADCGYFAFVFPYQGFGSITEIHKGTKITSKYTSDKLNLTVANGSQSQFTVYEFAKIK